MRGMEGFLPAVFLGIEAGVHWNGVCRRLVLLGASGFRVACCGFASGYGCLRLTGFVIRCVPVLEIFQVIVAREPLHRADLLEQCSMCE